MRVRRLRKPGSNWRARTWRARTLSPRNAPAWVTWTSPPSSSCCAVRPEETGGASMKKWAALSVVMGLGTVAHAQSPPPAPRPTCTRESLMAAVDNYLAAQRAGDRTKMTVADKVTYLENMNESAADKGQWNTALPIAFSRSFYDRDRCRTFSEVIVTEGPHQYVIGTRLSVDQGKVTKINSLVSAKGDWLFNANAYLKYSKQEDWKGGRAPMQDLINAANAYLDLFSDKVVKAPWGRPCARLEGGAYTNRTNDPNAT